MTTKTIQLSVPDLCARLDKFPLETEADLEEMRRKKQFRCPECLKRRLMTEAGGETMESKNNKGCKCVTFADLISILGFPGCYFGIMWILEQDVSTPLSKIGALISILFLALALSFSIVHILTRFSED